ncbi:MAG TPA: GatB/YqeY domain-containing protein [Euzebya sp.]|nr:GatB/YqeY domain-containing protein [Euzebya sp.]
MSLADQIQTDLTTAMKARDKVRTTTLRSVLAGIKNLRAEAGRGDRDIADAEVVDIISREAKKRRESIQTYADNDRPELAEAEQAELDVLTRYLPEQMDEAAIRAVVDQTVSEVGATGPGDLGKVMGALMPKVKGKADGKLVNTIVRQALND